MASSDDGAPLPVKEGVLLDRDGTPLLTPSESANAGENDGAWNTWNGTSGHGPRMRVVRLGGGGPGLLLLLVLLPLLMFAGLSLAAIFAAVFLIFALVRGLLRLLR